MVKQAFVKAYVCFQTTASPRPFDYEYDQILDRHLIVQNIIHFGHLLYHSNFSLQSRVALKKKQTVSVEKRVPKIISPGPKSSLIFLLRY